jgi:formate/nitrite transporter FocA (FNT family)
VFAGSLLLVQFMVAGHVFVHREAFTIELALKKTSYSFGATLTKGILCNWLVCMAVWQGNAAQDITGKLLGIWFPISAFVTMVSGSSSTSIAGRSSGGRGSSSKSVSW